MAARQQKQEAPTEPAEQDWIDAAIRELPVLCKSDEVIKFLRTSERNFHRLLAEGKIKTLRRKQDGSSPHLIPRAEIGRYLRSLEQ